MSADFDSELQRKLEGLGAETGHVGLPGPAAARSRARQRARNQALGAVLGAVVIVGGGVIAVAQPSPSAAPDFANTPSVTATTTVEPSPTPSVPSAEPSPDPTPEGPILPDAVLLTVEDLQQDGVPVIWRVVDAPDDPWECAPEAQLVDDRSPLRRSFGTEGSRLDQIVEASTPEKAAVRFAEIRDDVVACVEGLGDGYRFGFISVFTGLGDEAWQASYWAPPRDEDAATLVRIDLVRTGIAVTSVVSGGFAMDDNYPADWDRAAAATNRLCEAAGGACVSEVVRELLYPTGATDLAGWLTPEDIVETTGLSAITFAGEAMPKDDGSLGFVCLEQNAIANGATSLVGRFYRDPADPGGLTVEEVVSEFATDDEALAYFEVVAAEGDSCAAEPDMEVQNIGADAPGPQDAFGFTTWRATSISTGATWILGLAVNGPAVIYVNYGVQSDQDVSAEQMQALLERAAARYSNP